MVLTRHAEAEGPRWAADGRLLAEGTELEMNDRNYYSSDLDRMARTAFPGRARAAVLGVGWGRSRGARGVSWGSGRSWGSR